MRIIPKNLQQKSEVINHFVKNVDWNKLEKSLLLRQYKNNISQIYKMLENITSTSDNDIRNLEVEILKLPNNVHPRVWDYGYNPKEIYRFSTEKDEKYFVEFSELCKNFNLLRMEHLGNYTGHKSYYFFGKLSELEQALIQYAIDVLKKNFFKLLSVPDILPKEIIKGCGMQTDGDRNQQRESANHLFSYNSGWILDEHRLHYTLVHLIITAHFDLSWMTIAECICKLTSGIIISYDFIHCGFS